MTDTVELDALWDEFHSVVNMTSQELAAWLRAGEIGETAMGSEPPPGRPGAPTGLLVLALLQKRRADLTDEDVATMYEVIDTVEAEADGPDAGAGDERVRHRLMTLGHDPQRRRR
ncbi:DUF3140 domain-containing protein [Streptomyces sp. NPDC060235]|uniref:DUF3140 domain-containing protein n=1 Tax=Streptomyces sp. NPDC060235 TaxID=3347080 RepID=UPI00365482E2